MPLSAVMSNFESNFGYGRASKVVQLDDCNFHEARAPPQHAPVCSHERFWFLLVCFQGSAPLCPALCVTWHSFAGRAGTRPAPPPLDSACDAALDWQCPVGSKLANLCRQVRVQRALQRRFHAATDGLSGNLCSPNGQHSPKLLNYRATLKQWVLAQSVSLERFETERLLELVPPDGEFAVMNYRSTHPFKPPFRVTCTVEDDPHSAFKARAPPCHAGSTPGCRLGGPAVRDTPLQA